MPMGREMGKRFEGLPEDEQGRPWQNRAGGEKFKSIMQNSGMAVRDKRIADLEERVRVQDGLIKRIRKTERDKHDKLVEENRRLKGEIARLQRLLKGRKHGVGS